MRALTAILLLSLLVAATSRRLHQDKARICIYCSSAGRKTFTTFSTSVACKYEGKTKNVQPVAHVPNQAAKKDRGCPVNLIIDGTTFILHAAQDQCPTSTVTEC